MTTIILDATGAPKRQEKSLLAVVGPRAERFLLGAGFLLVLFVGWQLVTALRIEPPILLPSPAEVIGALLGLFSSSKIWADLAASGKELLYGYSLAAVVGIASGLVIGWYPRLGYFFEPFISFLYAIPRVALGPLLVVWLGIGLHSKVALVFLIAVFPVLVNTSGGVRLSTNISFAWHAASARVISTSFVPLRCSVRCRLSSAASGLRSGRRSSVCSLPSCLGSAWRRRADPECREQFQTDLVFAGLLIFAATGMLLTTILRGLQRRFDAWRGNHTIDEGGQNNLLQATNPRPNCASDRCTGYPCALWRRGRCATPLTMSYSQKTIDFLPVWMASDVGFFKQQGLDVTVRYCRTGTHPRHHQRSGADRRHRWRRRRFRRCTGSEHQAPAYANADLLFPVVGASAIRQRRQAKGATRRHHKHHWVALRRDLADIEAA